VLFLSIVLKNPTRKEWDFFLIYFLFDIIKIQKKVGDVFLFLLYMAEKKETMMNRSAMCQACMNGCQHNCYGDGRHVGLRWILGIVVILLVFAFGFKLGEVNTLIMTSINGGFGGRMMRSNVMWLNDRLPAPSVDSTTIKTNTTTQSPTTSATPKTNK
jgi:hypothetical protein